MLSIITPTGFATADFNLWPQFSKVLLVPLMIGACSGSTAGGIKVTLVAFLLGGGGFFFITSLIAWLRTGHFFLKFCIR